MTTSRGINLPRGTRQRWVEENQGRYRCQCGCGRDIPLRPAHYGKPPRLLQGHGARKYQPQPATPCACGCGAMATPGRRYISGHNSQGQKRSDATREKLRQAKLGEKNPMHGKLGPENPGWKGGSQRHGSGYILKYRPDHPFARKRYVMQHRLVAEDSLRQCDPASPFLVESGGGLYLSPEADVHHDNEVKDDNRLENLVVMWKGDHTRHHLPALISARHRSAVTASTLNEMERAILDYLRPLGEDYAGSIAAAIGSSRGGVRYALARMEKAGLLNSVKRKNAGRSRLYYAATPSRRS